MSLRAEVRECPATYVLAASWVAVYLAMLAVQRGTVWTGGGFLGFGGIRTETSHLFGDLRWNGFPRGQVWRVLTATFIHFSAAHLVMNLIGMIQLGRLMEEWYGGRQFLAIGLGLGSAGNLLGVLMRQGVAAGRDWLQAHGMAKALPAALAGGPPGMARMIHAGGGSTVILGLIGLGLVVGWRSRTRVGAFLRDQMVAFLVFTAIIGVVGMKIVDNYGHAGGAISGAVTGFFHRGLVRSSGRVRARRLAGWASALVLLGCVGGQAYVARGDLAEARREAGRREAIARLGDLEALVGVLGQVREAVRVVALDRSAAVLDEALRRGDPAPALGADVSTAFESLFEPTAPTTADRLRAYIALSQQLAALHVLGPRLGPELADAAYREVQDVGRALLAGPIGPHALYALRVDLDDLVRRASRARDEWRARAASFDG